MKVTKKILNAEPSILEWSIDSEDVDNVLRVETENLEEQYIALILERRGLICTPMILNQINKNG